MPQLGGRVAVQHPVAVVAPADRPVASQLAQQPWANRIGEEVGAEELRAALATMERLVAVIEADQH